MHFSTDYVFDEEKKAYVEDGHTHPFKFKYLTSKYERVLK